MTEKAAIIGTEYVKTGNKVKSAMAGGLSRANAESNCAQIFRDPGVQKAISLALERANATIDRVAGVLDKGLSAHKVIDVTINGKRQSVIVEDLTTQHQFARTTAELRNWFPDKKVKLDHSGSIGITDEDDKELVGWLLSALKK